MAMDERERVRRGEEEKGRDVGRGEGEISLYIFKFLLTN